MACGSYAINGNGEGEVGKQN